jgi:hypothetical protein
MVRGSVGGGPWRDRIVGSGHEAPSALLPNTANRRTDPPEQQRALARALSEVGWIQDAVVNRRSGRVIDGHLRVELAMARGESSGSGHSS